MSIAERYARGQTNSFVMSLPEPGQGFEQDSERGTIRAGQSRAEPGNGGLPPTSTPTTSHSRPASAAGQTSFGARLRQARLAARGGQGLGQQDLAKLLGVSQAAISDYERGRRRPSLEALADIARHLGADAGWLLTGRAAELPSPALETATAHPAAHAAPGQAPATAADLLRHNLGELMGISALPHHGRIGLLEGGVLRAAEQRAGYGAGGRAGGDAHAADPAGQEAQGSFVFDRALAHGAEALAEYEGPATGPFRPGDVLLLAYSDGYPGVRVFRRPGGTAEPGEPEMAVEPDGVSVKVTAGPRVVALLRQV